MVNSEATFSKFGLPKSVADLLNKGQEENVTDVERTKLWEACADAGLQYQQKVLAVLGFDADKIKEYVFSSPKLPEIRGASELIKKALGVDAIGKILKEFGLLPESIIFASGGCGLLVVTADKVEALGANIEKSFAEESLGATVTWGYIDVHPIELVYGYRCVELGLSQARELVGNNLQLQAYFECPTAEELTPLKWQKRKCFGELVAVLSIKLQKKKAERELHSFFETIPYAERCTSCGMRAAGHELGYEEKKVCEVCWNKYQSDPKRTDHDTQAEYFKDLGKIGDAGKGRARGYIGVVYADGDNMGSVLQELTTIEKYSEWSSFIDKTFNASISDILSNLAIDAGHYQRLVIGGDDIILFLPADKAFRFVEQITKDVTSRLHACGIIPGELCHKMGLSAGILVAHDHFPALYLVEYAEQLLKNAKRYGKRNRPGPQSAIDFAILTDSSPLSTEISSVRQSLYSRSEEIRRGRYRKMNLTSRPYTLSEFSEFLKNAKALKAFVPPSQIYMLRESLQNRHKEEAEINFMYQVARCKQGKSWRRWVEEVTGIPWNCQDIREVIWEKQDEDSFLTSLLDYTEVYHFI
ncbi:MAG: hypothetical protein ABSG91_20180 [Syntrophobacteraceae bacterium]|jgi:CRISPR-associated protein Cmr2